MTRKTIDDRIQKSQNKLKRLYLKKFRKTKGGIHEKRAACWEIHGLLKPDKLLESKFLTINFQLRGEDPAILENQLQKAVELKRNGELSERDETMIAKFVTYIHKNKIRMDGFESAQEALILANVSAENYIIRDTIRELSSAGQIIWETMEVEETEDTRRFWGLDYNKRRKLEAKRLHFYIKMKGRHAPRTVRGGGNEFLPVMYWKKEKNVNGQPTTLWVEHTRGKVSKKGEKEPPLWATNYIKQKNLEITKFLPEDNPNMLRNAVYLLLCRFIGEGVPEKARIQAYAGKATNGVENRWLQHAGKSKELIQCYSKFETFSESLIRLGKPLLVDVVIGRLYAQCGRRGLTENDTTEHDNIALFVCNAFGAGKTGEDHMKQKEKDLIRNLKLTDMMYGMNGRVG